MAGINTLRSALCDMLGLTGTLRGAPVYLLFDLISLFGAAPLFLGFVRYASRRIGDGAAVIGELFYYLQSPPELLGVYRFCYSLMWRLLASLTPAAALLGAYLYIFRAQSPSLFGFAFASQQYRQLALGILAVALIIALISAGVWSLRYFAAIYLFICDQGREPRLLMRDAVRLMRGRHADALLFCLGFADWFALSALSFGLVLILFALPYFVCAYICYCSFACIGTRYGEDGDL